MDDLLVLKLSLPFIGDDAFFNRTRLERVGVVGPELGLLLDRSAGSER